MTIKVNEVEFLKKYFLGVVKRSEHHALNVNEIVYPLLGLIIFNMDENSDIQVRDSEGTTGNMLWFTVNEQRYALRYEHDDKTIEIREHSYRGDMVAKIDNSTSISDLKIIFKKL